MRVTIERLRRWVLGAACLLVAVVAGFVLYGRYRFRHIEKDLPARLGANIQQTATGWSYSQSSEGHTLFTIKASKESQLKSGHVLLHDVDITLYGAPGSGRQDRIWGSDFDYDEKAGIAISQGDVNIELSGVNGSTPAAPGTPPQSNAIRVRTSGLTFMQKTGDANTAQPVEFQLPRAAGSAVGASYNSKTGVLVLNSAVKITTSSNGRSAVVNAAHATMLRNSMQAFLDSASMQYEQEDGSADAATVFFRRDGTAERIDAKGHVRMRNDNGATVASEAAQVLMNSDSEPTQAALDGGVQFAAVQPNQRMQGSAGSGTLLFASEGESGETALHHAEFRQAVHFTDEIAGLPKDPRGRATKQVQGEKVDVDFAPKHKRGAVQASKVTADGSPVVTMQQIPSKGPEQSTRISGDQLVATLGAGNVLQTLDGTGHTRLVEQGADGSHDTSQGDVLHATFAQQAGAAVPGNAKPVKSAKEQEPRLVTTLDTAIQDGHVVMTETPTKKPGAATQPATLTGWAQHAEFHAADEVLHLTGRPRIDDGQTMQMAAERIDYHRRTQDAAAEGNVKATYTQEGKGQGGAVGFGGGGNGPVHIVAGRAAMQHASQTTDFFGTVSDPARMWQGGDTLTAPVIEIDRSRDVLKAWGEDTGGQPAVRATFLTTTKKGQQPSSAEVQSQTLLYSDKDRQADFHGSVTMEQADGVIHADDGRVFLKPERTEKSGAEAEKQPEQKQGSQKQNSQIQRMVAQGHVVFTQPGRKGEGEKLVYTADDGRYVLTGTPELLPRLWDSTHGTTTGVALLFNTQDDSVEVSGGKSSAVTETRAPR